MSDLKRLFQITLGLAKQVKTHLMTNQIDKAKEETSELIISCERELQVLQKQPISKELSQETYQVLMAARKALRELESHELHSDVKRIINLIVKIEKQEIKEVSEHEKEMTKFYNYWYNNCYL